MWSVRVVVIAIDAEHVLEMPTPDDRYSIEAIGAERAYPALGIGVRVRGLDWCADHADSLAPEDVVEGVTELRVAVMDEKAERLLVAELHHQVPCLLGHPVSVGVAGAGDVLDPPPRERDEEQDVDPLEKCRLDSEEVAGDHARRLDSQEGAPRELRSPWRGPQACLEQHLAHRRRRNANPEALELADDPFVSPVWVLTREPQDQLAQRAFERRPASGPMCVRPAARDQLTVPAQQRLRFDHEARPRGSWDDAAERSEQRTIGTSQRRSASLPA